MKSQLNNIQILKREDLLSFFLNNLAYHLKPDVYENVVVYVDELLKIKLENNFLYNIPKNELRGSQELFLYKIEKDGYLLFEREEFNVWLKAKSINNGNEHDMEENTQLYLNVIKENVFKNTNVTTQLETVVKNVLAEVKRNIEDITALKVSSEIKNADVVESIREINSKLNEMVVKVDTNDNKILSFMQYVNNLVDVLCKKINVNLTVTAEIQRQLNTLYGNESAIWGTDSRKDKIQLPKRKSFWKRLFN